MKVGTGLNLIYGGTMYSIYNIVQSYVRSE